jgi:hypothetical protein
MESIGKGVLAALIVSGSAACSDVTGQAPIAETQLAAPAAFFVTDKDAVIVSPASGYGALTVCGAHGPTPQGATERSCLMHWPVPPMNVTVRYAELDLHVTDASLQATTLYPLKKHFAEIGATWAVTGNGVSWQTPGAKGASDRGPSLGAQTFGNLGDATFVLNASNGGLPLVQSWFDDPSKNFGIIFENNSTDRVQFSTRENGSPDLRPTLYVEYTENDDP